MKYLVTGGSGFLGSYVAKQFLARGDEVVCFDLPPKTGLEETSLAEVLTKDEMEKVKFVGGDITDDKKLVELCKEEKIDMIIHLAAMLTDACQKNMQLGIRVNILGTINCFEAARACNMKRVVYASSGSVFGNKTYARLGVVGNEAPHDPDSIYGKMKDFVEYCGKFYHDFYGLETIGLRFTVIYGKGRKRGGANFIKAMLNDPALGIPSVADATDGSNFVYVADCARACLLATQIPYKRHAYTITGETLPAKELLEYVKTILPDARIELRINENSSVPRIFDTTAEEQELGYIPEYDLRKGALATINSVRADEGLPPVGIE